MRLRAAGLAVLAALTACGGQDGDGSTSPSPSPRAAALDRTAVRRVYANLESALEGRSVTEAHKAVTEDSFDHFLELRASR